MIRIYLPIHLYLQKQQNYLCILFGNMVGREGGKMILILFYEDLELRIGCGIMVYIFVRRTRARFCFE